MGIDLKGLLKKNKTDVSIDMPAEELGIQGTVPAVDAPKIQVKPKAGFSDKLPIEIDFGWRIRYLNIEPSCSHKFLFIKIKSVTLRIKEGQRSDEKK